jgi:hypothetical protein
VQLDKKKNRELQKRQKEAEKRSKSTMALKLREVDPPDDLEIELADLRAQQRATLGHDAVNDKAIVRPQFPPESIISRLRPAFSGMRAA